MKMPKAKVIELANGEFLATIKKNGKVFVGDGKSSAVAVAMATAKVERYFSKDKTFDDYYVGMAVKVGSEVGRIVVLDFTTRQMTLEFPLPAPTPTVSDDGPEIV